MHCQKWLKGWTVLKPGTPEHQNTGTPEHRNTGTREHRNTLEHSRTPQSTPEHRNSQKNTGTPNLTMLFCFPITDHVKNKMSM